MQRVSLNLGGKNSSGGLRDNESILSHTPSHTPPNREYATGTDINASPEFGHGVKFYQPIHFTVNINNDGQSPALI